MARLSNSAFVAFNKCPTLFQEQFINGYQKEQSYLQFGHRWHQYLQAHYDSLSARGLGSIPPAPDLDPQIELEVQSMFEAYKAFYPTEPFEVLETERYFEIPFGPDNKHTYIGRIDARVRNKETRKVQIFETKSEKRGGKRNLPKAWVARTQATLYLWAAEKIFNESVDSIILNVCTKGSEKGLVGPSFRRDTLQRTPQQVEQAIRDLTWVADQIDSLDPNQPFPRDTNQCVSELGWECDYYLLCHYGRTPETLSQLVQVEPFSYLSM